MINGAELPSEIVVRDLGVLVSADLDFSTHIERLIKSASLLINTIFRCFAIKDPDVYIRLYRSLVLSKILYCSPVWEPYLKKHRNLIESVQKKFKKRLYWRCSIQKSNIVLPPISSLLQRQNIRSLSQLQRANLSNHFFDIKPNNLQSGCSILPKAVARTEHVNNCFAWRMSRWLHENGAPEYLLSAYQ